MKTKMYLHSNKDSNYELGESLGLEGEALRKFAYALSEVAFEVAVDPGTGDTTIITVDGKPLVSDERKVFIQDDDAHWYLIPAEKYKHFTEIENDADQLNDAFEQYRSSAPHCYSVLDPKEEL